MADLDYRIWNDLIGRHFFRPESSGSRVYLFVTSDLIAQLGQPYGMTIEKFVTAVKIGPPWARVGGLCDRAELCFRDWRRRKLEFPPYVGYLALFVLAAGVEGDFAPHAYYPRLRALLGEAPQPGTYPRFGRMKELWEDLELWSNNDKSGTLGIFNVLLAGNWVHVGLPIAQTLLTDDERNALPAIFAAAALDPTAPPRDKRLAHLVSRFGQHTLRPRTLRLLDDSNPESEIHSALVGVLRDELLNWDGSVKVHINGESKTVQRHGLLKLSCNLDGVARQAQFGLRCRTAEEFPESGLVLTENGTGRNFYCIESISNWSTLLADKDFIDVDAAGFDWGSELVMHDEERGWRLRMPGSDARILISGVSEGLPGLIEIDRLPTSGEFFLAVRLAHSTATEEWGRSSCNEFSRMDSLNGMPLGWAMYSASGVQNDEGIAKLFPALRLPTTTRISLRGGLRATKGNQFYGFAPPRIELDGGAASLVLRVASREILLGMKPGVYELPTDLSTNVPLLVEARGAGDVLGRMSFTLLDDIPWPRTTIARRFDGVGRVVVESTPASPFVTGAVQEGIDGEAFDFDAAFQWSMFRKEAVVFIGSVPGQFLNWPIQPIPSDWTPIWAIRRRGRRVSIHFCASGISNAEPRARGNHPRKNLRNWSALLKFAGRRAAAPSSPGVAALWKRYIRAARDA